MAVFDPLPQGELAVRVAQLETQVAALAVDLAAAREQLATADAQVAEERELGDAAGLSAQNAEAVARQRGDQFLADLIGDHIIGGGGPIARPRVYLPLVTGDLPGPEFLSNSDGEAVFVEVY